MKRIPRMTWLAGAGLLFPSLWAAPLGDGSDAIEAARATLDKWVETRRTISAERRDWELGRETMTDRIALVQREIEALRAKVAEAEKSIAEADGKRAELVERNDSLQHAAQALVDTLTLQEGRTRALLARLPDPIRERVKPLSQRLPEDATQTKLALAERFQNVVGILNEVGKFNREITATSEVRTLPDGSAAEVTALYVGIGQGYYVSASGKLAGVGTAGPEGWTWTPANGLAADIAAAIAILANERVASFVRLPLEIR